MSPSPTTQSSRSAEPLDVSSARKYQSVAIGPFHRVKALFLVAAFASFVLSVSLWFTGYRDEGLFVGIWVPAIHSLGSLILTGERDRLEGARS